jgi:hypothetical protein
MKSLLRQHTSSGASPSEVMSRLRAAPASPPGRNYPEPSVTNAANHAAASKPLFAAVSSHMAPAWSKSDVSLNGRTEGLGHGGDMSSLLTSQNGQNRIEKSGAASAGLNAEGSNQGMGGSAIQIPGVSDASSSVHSEPQKPVDYLKVLNMLQQVLVRVQGKLSQMLLLLLCSNQISFLSCYSG